MKLDPLAGKPVPQRLLVNVPELVSAYFLRRPDSADPRHAVRFGTSGHRGCSLQNSFNEAHICAIVQAVCLYRRQHGIDGPLFLGKDTHALSEPAHATALEVLAANGVDVVIHSGQGYTPTPVISHLILTWNRGRARELADGLVITPSHNPPSDGGIKYNPPEGGPADVTATDWIAAKANELLARGGDRGVRRIPYERALQSDCVREQDFVDRYVRDLGNVVDLEAVAQSGLRLGADALGGSGLAFWHAISEQYGLDIEVRNDHPDPTFSFMTVDRDGKVRMDCSSPWAMAGLIDLKDRYDVAVGNDPDFDRHGIVTPTSGLMDPNHYLSVAVWYLFNPRHRPDWPEDVTVGKTLVSSSMIDRVAKRMSRRVIEVPVGFKWFVPGLLAGTCGFGGEESAGASFLRRNGHVWTTDKDGIILGLLAAEIMARTGKDPGEIYRDLTRELGEPVYERIDEPATPAQKAVLKKLTPECVRSKTLAGEPICATLTKAPGNGQNIGGLKVVTRNGWFAARPSGTEDIYKIYAESFRGIEHLRQIQAEARELVSDALADA
ncbi:MAG: alpha-D-glucose phosphate-specific phosphoglucomutase [Kiritimatiellaeota bacterium]|nr:alpha-D-glucose phosphate-specific phosphoglucomutase [Kiritimatiellota bacterium]